MINESNLDLISILRISSTDDIRRSVKKGFDSLGKIGLGSESVVAIKPNLCAIKSHETGATTDPRVVEEIVRYLNNEYGVSDISIVESDGSRVLADIAFRLLGYEKLAKKMDLKLVNLSRSPFSLRSFPGNAFVKKVRVPRILEQTDFLISVPKIKTHIDCLLTCALKNQFGCNPFSRKTIYHTHLDDAIVDLSTIFKPDMVVVDGNVITSRGPATALPFTLKLAEMLVGKEAAQKVREKTLANIALK